MKLKKKSLFAILGVLPLLTACSSIGLAKERYDGRVLEQDERRIAAYQENREIVGEEKEKYINEALQEFLSKPVMPFPDEDIYLGLISKPYIVGKDIPEGRYQVFYEGTYAEDDFTVRNKNGEILYEFPLGFMIPSFELNLYKGQSIEGSKEELLANFLVSERISSPEPVEHSVTDAKEYTFSNGVWYVGEHLPSGKYQVSVPSDYSSYIPHLFIYKPDGEFQVYELLGSFTGEEFILNLTLEEGSSFLIENSPSLTFISIED